MYIKSITLQGFKSYRDQDAAGGKESDKSKEFCPGANLIVGKNGSGKSNFFSAIQFVLGKDKFAKILPEQRRALLHEGTGRTVLSAYVEIVFDNSDGRLQVGPSDSNDPVVTIRRTVGLKKDEYRVNDKASSASEVQQIFEVAGLSAQNPYNIVQQGRISRFAMMSDEQRFEVIKDVAGTQVYENRREESVKLLEKTFREMDQIQENLAQVDQKMKDLGQEREEFKAYQEVERKRRALQYCYYDQQAKEARSKLSALQADYSAEAEQTGAKFEDADGIKRRQSELQEKIDLESKQLVEIKARRESAIRERTLLSKKHAKAASALSEAKGNQEDASGQRGKLTKELEEVEARIKEAEKTRPKLEAESKKAQSAAEEAHDRLRSAEQRVNELLARRKRKDQFATKAERDKYLKEEIKKLEAVQGKLDKDMKRQQKEITALEKAVEDNRRARETRESEMQSREKEFAPLREKARKAAQKATQDADRRRLNFNKQAELQKELEEHQGQVQKWIDRQQRTVPADIRKANDNVKEICHAHGIQGVWGPVVGLMKVPQELWTACDVVAGNRLFHIVVDSSKTVQEILKIFNKEKREGRPSFYPLDRLNAKKMDLPTDGDRCFPLYDKIDMHPHYQKVRADLFGKALVVNTLEVGGDYSRKYNCDCITAQGDQVDRRGGISGGWLDREFGRCQSQMEAEKAINAVEAVKKQLALLKEEGAKMDQEVQRSRAERVEAERLVEEGKGWTERANVERKTADSDLDNTQKRLKALQKDLADTRLRQKDATAQKETFERELQTDMVDQLSEGEQKELGKLQESLSGIKQEHAEKDGAAVMAAAKLSQLTESLRGNLHRREADLRARLSNLAADGSADKLRRAQDEEQATRESLAALEKEVKELDKEMDKHNSALKKAQEEAEETKNQAEKAQKALEEAKQRRIGKEEHRRELEQRVAEAMERIRKIGVLPEAKECGKYEHKTQKQLIQAMKDANQEIAQFSMVNKKAADMYSQLQEQMSGLRAQFEKRQQERKELEDLIKNLDEKKDEAVLRTFKQVKLHFKDKFASLVGHEGAHGDISLKRRSDLGKERSKDRSGKGAAVDEFCAAPVRVNFGIGGDVGGKGDHDMSRLSGGQKSVVALALIFAIQATDPAPFYVFDEVDAALDAEYRTNVAAMVEHMSKQGAQYLIASFKVEMAQVCQKHFAISFANKVSRMNPCSLEHALRILKAVEQDQREAGGGVTRTPAAASPAVTERSAPASATTATSGETAKKRKRA
eukprot:TRINITY_DN1588_c5_g1_i1.p1 TRINITY_DN1588_c5_g1~~TRINITY_DN1588_c5_g1_i1.p1  ORF type:complete len:1262 (+),score=578.53 TRINITY_DN1588_c5_g1_i1:119-3904(+)